MHLWITGKGKAAIVRAKQVGKKSRLEKMVMSYRSSFVQFESRIRGTNATERRKIERTVVTVLDKPLTRCSFCSGFGLNTERMLFLVILIRKS